MSDSSGQSWQNSNCEWFAPVAQVAHDKRATEAICSFSWANCSFAHKYDWFAGKTDKRISNPAVQCAVGAVDLYKVFTDQESALKILRLI